MTGTGEAPLVAPGQTATTMTDAVCAVPLGGASYRWWWAAFVPALALLAGMAVAVGRLFYLGIRIWGNNWPNVWGFDILSYVWWIGIASGGTFISAFFFLVRVEWRTAINRIAETMTLFSALCAALYPILHLGRPWYFYWLFPYPNTMDLWPNFKSPLMWDFIAILTYVVASALFWLFGLLPDLATLRDRAAERRTRILYGIAALGFRGDGRQWRHFRAIYAVMAAVMAPLVCSVHSVVGLDFAGGEAAGWHASFYPPFFVFGAVLSGFAAVLLLVIPLRRIWRFHAYITARHIDVLCRLTLTASLCVSYAYLVEIFTVYYAQDATELRMFHERLFGFDSGVYWATIVLNCLLPQLYWWRAARRTIPTVLVVSLGAVVGMWLERYGIVIQIPRIGPLPSSWGYYHPTLWDWTLFAGTVGLFATGFLLTIRVVPAISMFEMRALLPARRA
ncbi:NrfD/PsrC family molybdoenzyme membrane anchor subunit [Nguyenibacter vanlangensis]|uniref:NrfD/PsrC family molybdoenzyme membrane anchor subunit n=1 Tax=Nguyenibacter vanlangensis TaxID=1216886 RepID=A0ABZ3D941_9PROT